MGLPWNRSPALSCVIVVFGQITGGLLVAYRHIVLVDKPKGPTSHDVVQMTKRALGAKKAGHTGTLDPNATGLLVIALDEATKAMPAFAGLQKEYVAVVHLHGDVASDAVRAAAAGFVGEITQIPPVRSRVKRQPRRRRVFELEVLDRNGRDVAIRTLVEAGTYIRNLACDLGQALGCGGHLVQIRRTRVGPFSSASAQTPGELAGDGARLYSLEAALAAVGVELLTVSRQDEDRLRNGSTVKAVDFPGRVGDEGDEKLVGACDSEGGLVALGLVKWYADSPWFQPARIFAR